MHVVPTQSEVCLPLLLHGPSGSGKTLVLRDVLEQLKVPTAHIDCVISPGERSIYESALNQLASHIPCAGNNYTNWSHCDTLAVFVAGLRQLALVHGRVCIVFDRAERLTQRGSLLQTILALPTLCTDTAVNVVLMAEAPFPELGTQPWELSADFSKLLRIHFPGYSLPELCTVMKRDTHNVITRVRTDNIKSTEASRSTNHIRDDYLAMALESFTPVVVDFFSNVCRDMHELRHLVRELFPQYIRPALDGRVSLADNRKLIQEGRDMLRSSLRRIYTRDGVVAAAVVGVMTTTEAPASLLATVSDLPRNSKFLLLAAYLASRYSARLDVKLFSSAKRGSGVKRSRRPITADVGRSFTIERLIAIYHAVQFEQPHAHRAELLVHLATLTRMQESILWRISFPLHVV